MLRRLGKRSAQATAEYAILIALVIGAAMAMQIYVKRGLQGRVRDVVDHTGSGGDVGGATLQFNGGQYEPYYLSSSASKAETTNETENQQEGGSVARTSDTSTTAARTLTIHPSGEE